jgi:fructose-bisphosphate aldolase class II
MLISGKLGLRNTLENNYALPAFNYTNLEGIKAIIEAAEEMNSPVIIQVTQGAVDYAGFEYLRDLGTGAAVRSKVPVVLHLDHGKDYNYLLKAFRYGWTSLMMDASHESFEKNADIVKEVVKMASPLDVAVEAELGVIGGKEDDLEVDEAIYTEVNEAIEFAKLSNCDSLAIAVGTAHGIYKGEVKINYDRIEEIKKASGIPLVLHGSSGVPDEMVTKAVKSGINKVNFDTELKLANLAALNKFLAENPGVYDVRKIYKPCIEAMKEVVKAKIRACGSENKSWI